jgi:peroxiredoxin family protein/TusA-related sulfurtransferase
MKSENVVLVDCQGLRCPAPILEVSKAAQRQSAPALLRAVATDKDFPRDIEAWCRSTGHRLARQFTEPGGIYVAEIELLPKPGALSSAQAALAPSRNNTPTSLTVANPSASRPGESRPVEGRSGPAPQVSAPRHSQSGPGPLATTNPQVPSPRTISSTQPALGQNRAASFGSEFNPTRENSIVTAIDTLRPTPEPSASVAFVTVPEPTDPQDAELAPTPPPHRVPTPIAGLPLADLRGQSSEAVLLRLSAMLLQSKSARFTTDAPGFETKFNLWRTLTQVDVLSSQNKNGTITAHIALRDSLSERPPLSVSAAFANQGTIPALPAVDAPDLTPTPTPLLKPTETLSQPPAELTPSFLVSPSLEIRGNPVAAQNGLAPQENRGSLLVMHNDFEEFFVSLLLAASASAQNIPMDIFFCFWGVNLLRDDKPKPGAKKPSFWQRLVQFLLPKGPRRQKLGKLHLGGVGKGILGHIMKEKNVMNLDGLIQVAVEKNIRFLVCSMSMELLGLQEEDLLRLPNVQISGMTSFVELSMRSRMSMAF